MRKKSEGVTHLRNVKRYERKHWLATIKRTSDADMGAEIDRQVERLEKLGDGRAQANVVAMCPCPHGLHVLFEYSLPVYSE